MKHPGLNSPFVFSLLYPLMKYRQSILKQQSPQEKKEIKGEYADPGEEIGVRAELFAV